MAKGITEKMGGFLNDLNMLDFCTVTMWMGYFYYALEALTLARKKGETDEAFKEKINALVKEARGRAGNVGTGKYAMDVADFISRRNKRADDNPNKFVKEKMKLPDDQRILKYPGIAAKNIIKNL